MASRQRVQTAAVAAWLRLPHPLRWLGAAVAGSTLILVGVVLLVLPGPGLLLIALGLAVLATEFVWAQALLHRVRHHTVRVSGAVVRKVRPTNPRANSAG